MSIRLPLFPLSIVSFPGEPVNLHIFEPRYKQLINECWAEQKTFGLPPFIDNRVMDYGTEMKILEISKRYPDGEMDIKTLGLRTFKLVNFHKTVPDKLYSIGEVVFHKDEENIDPNIQKELKIKMTKLFGHLGIKKELKDVQSFAIAHYIGLSLIEQYNLLTISSEQDRQVLILRHLEKIIPVIIRAQKIREQIKMNGHFKNFPKLDF